MYSVPDEDDKFVIRAHGLPGLEKLKIFATTEDIPLLVEEPPGLIFRTINPDERSVTRDLAVKIANIEENAWAEATAEFVLKEK